MIRLNIAHPKISCEHICGLLISSLSSEDYLQDDKAMYVCIYYI